MAFDLSQIGQLAGSGSGDQGGMMLSNLSNQLGFTDFGMSFGPPNQFSQQTTLPKKPAAAPTRARTPAQTTQANPQQQVMQTVPNTTQNFMAPVQQLLNRMNTQNTQQKAINAQIAQNQQAQAAAQQAQMGMYLNRASNRMEGNFQEGTGILRSLTNDPQLNNLIEQGFEQMQNPGLSREAIAGMKGQAAATGAANLASSQRRLSHGLAGRGMSGASRAFMQQNLQNRAGNSLSRQMTGIDIEAEKFAQQRQGQSMSQLQSLIGQRQGAARGLAGALLGNNPLNQLQQIQQIQSPQQQLGFNIGALQ